MSDRTIELTTTIESTPERVFRALVDPDELVRWFPSRAESEPRTGGAFEYRFEFDDASRNHTYGGDYSAVVENERVAYPWHGKLGTTEVEFRLSPVGDSTDVSVRHSGWGTGADWDESVELHRQGWGFFLGNLKAYLEREEDARESTMGMKTPAARPA